MAPTKWPQNDGRNWQETLDNMFVGTYTNTHKRIYMYVFDTYVCVSNQIIRMCMCACVYLHKLAAQVVS